MNIKLMLERKGLYYDVIGVIVDYIGGDKSYWKQMNESVLRVISHEQIKTQKVNFETLKRDFLNFISLQQEYDIYNRNQNVIASIVKNNGKSIGIRAYLKQQHVVAQLYYHKLINRLRRNEYNTFGFHNNPLSNQSTQMLTDFDYTPSVYAFGNIQNVHRIMNNYWVGSIYHQYYFSITLHELKYAYEKKQKQKYIEIRKLSSFETGKKFCIKNNIYQIINVYKNAIRFQIDKKKIIYRRFMKDIDQCVYVFVDALYRYKYYTDNTIEKI